MGVLRRPHQPGAFLGRDQRLQLRGDVGPAGFELLRPAAEHILRQIGAAEGAEFYEQGLLFGRGSPALLLDKLQKLDRSQVILGAVFPARRKTARTVEPEIARIHLRSILGHGGGRSAPRGIVIEMCVLVGLVRIFLHRNPDQANRYHRIGRQHCAAEQIVGKKVEIVFRGHGHFCVLQMQNAALIGAALVLG